MVPWIATNDSIVVGIAQVRHLTVPAPAPLPSHEMMAGLLACGPSVEPTTLQVILRVESGAQPYAINVNGLSVQPLPVRSQAEATATAESWVARGYSVDLGLMQVNSRNLGALGYSIAQMFDPCINVRAGAAVLTKDYLAALTIKPDPQSALRAALSAYNTGSFERGFYNGYVAKYYGAASGFGVSIITAAAFRRARRTAPLNPYTAQPTVYHRSGSNE